MRKALVFLLVLLAAGIFGTVYAADALSAGREDITFRWQSVYGDPKFAKNAEVQVHTMLDRHLFWDSTVTFPGGKAKPESTFRFTQTPFTGADRTVHSGVEIYSDIIVDELVDALEPSVPDGTSQTFHVRYADYCDYYPLHIVVDLEHIHYDNYGFTHGSGPGGTPEEDTINILWDTFRIPVMKEEFLDITINKAAYGMASGGGSAEGNPFSMWTSSVITDDAVYFWFSNRTSDGKACVDTSKIPLGYGIYRLPYGYVDEDNYKGLAHFKGWDTKTEELSLFYPIDPSVRAQYLALSPDGERLILHASENGRYVLTVLDIRTGETVQRLELGDADSFMEQYHGDNFVMVRFGMEQLCVLAWNGETGMYEPAIDAAITEKEKDEQFQPWFPHLSRSMAFDGEHFYIAGANSDDTMYTTRTYEKHCGFYLAVYDAEGLQYYGVYESSLDDAFCPGADNPEAMYHDPVTVHARQ